MKKNLLFFLIFIMVLGLVGCKKDPIDVPDVIEVTSVSLNKTNETLYVSDTLQLMASVSPDNATNKSLIWESSNQAVATVSNTGLVKAVSKGEAKITAKSNNNKTATLNLTVLEDEELPEGVIFDNDFDSSIMPKNFSLSTGGGGTAVIKDGNLNLTTVGTGNTNAAINFKEALQGTIVVETKVKVNTTAFTNVLFFYTSGSSTSDIVVALGFENNSIKYHDGSNWKNIIGYQLGEWYEINMRLNIGERIGDSVKGYFDVSINGYEYSGLSFRNGGDGVEDNIWRLELASSKANSDFSYDYLRIYESKKPNLVVTSNSGIVDLDVDPSYTFNYLIEGNPTPTVTISADKDAGYTIDGNTVTFTSSGVYAFTITASNKAGSVSEIVTLQVFGSVKAPQIDVVEKETVIILADNPTYKLLYNIIEGNPKPEITISSSKETGYTLDENIVTFTETGEYKFTITATNNGGSVTDDIIVYVLEDHHVLDYDFSSLPENVSTNTLGNGLVSVVEGALNIKAGGAQNSAFVSIPFGHKLSGVIVAETRFKVKTHAFSNALFFYTNNQNSTVDIAVSVAFENGNIKYHSGHGWTNIIGYETDRYYDLMMVLDVELGTFMLYVDNVEYGSYSFRNSLLKNNMTHLYIGSDKTDADMYYDYLKLSYGTLPEVSVEEEEATVDMDVNDKYELNYHIKEVYPLASTTITCDVELGYFLDGNIVTFTSAGVYTFTITSKNALGFEFKTITINVLGNSVAPSIVVENRNINYDLGSQSGLLLKYEISGVPTPEVQISVDKEFGCAIDGNLVNFTETGIYVFTITATNKAATVTETITVFVESYVAPSVSLLEETKVVYIDTNAHYQLQYEVSGTPIPVVQINVDHESGYELLDNNVRFTVPGTYTFTITVSNDKGIDAKDIIIEVVDLELNYLINEDFNADNNLPTSFDSNQSGSGSFAVIGDVAGANGNALQIKTTETSGSVNINAPFAGMLNGTIVTNMRLMVNSSAFTNALFFYANNSTSTTDIAACLAFENGLIRYHSGGWKSTGYAYDYNTWYDLKVVLNTKTATFDLYVDDEFTGNYPFRNANVKDAITHINFGTGKANTDFYCDELSVYYVPEVEVLEENKEVVVNLNDGSYTLLYNVLGEVDTPVITCDQENGYTLVDNTVTFTAVGTYVFTISASNNNALTSKATITVTVTD